MKKSVIIGTIICILLIIAASFAGGYFWGKRNKNVSTANTPSPVTTATTTPTNTISISTCSSNELQTLVETGAAAGSTYNTFTLKNISSKTCTLDGSKYIQIKYTTSSIPNINIINQGSVLSSSFNLEPNKALVATAQHPNGAQCGNNGTKQVTVNFIYEVTPSTVITFKGPDNNIAIAVLVCASNSIKTDITISGFSPQGNSRE